MDLLLVTLRVLHFVFGVFWVGTVFFLTLIFQPRLQRLGPAVQRPVMGALTPALIPAMMASSIITIGSGLALTLIMRWGTLGVFLASDWGWAMLIGTATTVGAVTVGFGFATPTARSMAKLGQSIQGRAPAPAELQELNRLARRFEALSRTNVVLLLIAVGTMAVARFI